MIAMLLARLAPYRLIGYGVALVALLAGYWGWHHHVFRQGADSRDAYYKPILAARDATIADQTAKALKAKAEADGLTATLGALAKQIGDEREKAKADLDRYRREHPFHLWVCDQPAKSSSSRVVPESSPSEVGATEGEGTLQPPRPRDIGPALDALMAEADRVNEDLRTCTTQYNALADSLTR